MQIFCRSHKILLSKNVQEQCWKYLGLVLEFRTCMLKKTELESVCKTLYSIWQVRSQRGGRRGHDPFQTILLSGKNLIETSKCSKICRYFSFFYDTWPPSKCKAGAAPGIWRIFWYLGANCQQKLKLSRWRIVLLLQHPGWDFEGCWVFLVFLGLSAILAPYSANGNN